MSESDAPRVGDTDLFYAEDLQIIDPETGLVSDLTAPTSVTLRVERDGVTIAEVAANQMGATNDFNAAYTYTQAGEHKFQFYIVKDASSRNTKPEVVRVQPSLADIP